MNEFEKRINALRLQFRDERVRISKDCDRHIGHLNNAISQTPFPEVRDALRAEKQRVYEAMRNSHKYSRLCYLQQLELLEDEQRLYRQKNPSNRQLRRMAAAIARAAETKGADTLSIVFGENRHCDITFA